MTNYAFRHAQESESSQIKALINLVGINPTGLDWKRFLVAVNESGQVIGCGQIKPHGGDIRELASIAVLPEYRGQGIARAVIEMLLREYPKPLYLMCIAHNGPMYEKFGFHVIEMDRMPRYFSRIKKLFNIAGVLRKPGEDLLVMKLE
ncbi:MAG TPA: GNAT family N-acetyltransferase [Anaerolineales bacterium]|nr:GNAT family N-acetyltransferase [Anaerolineales bacterium]